MQPARLAHEFHAGAEKEMIGVAEDDARAEIAQFIGRNPLDRRLRSYGHEDGGRKTPVRCVDHARACARRLVLANQFIGNRSQSCTPISKQAIS